MNFTRREFTRSLFAASAALNLPIPLLPALSAPAPQSQVIIARSDALKRSDRGLDASSAAHWLNLSLMALTNSSSPPAAWKSLFSPQEKVGLKLSCLPGPPLSTSIGLVSAIVAGLNSAGIKNHHIFIWERTGRELQNAGFKITRQGPVILGTDALPNGGYSNDIQISRSVGTCFSVIMEQMDALISVPVLKDHDIAGVSAAMKNFYGAIHNPNKFHGNHCDPYVADLCAHRYIRDKLRLSICDASRVQVHNGPAFFPRFAMEFGGLLVSRDPVALDFTGWGIIENHRKNLNLPSLEQEGRKPSYILTAAALNLGQADEKTIKVTELS